jgi:hypothetical protein
VDADFVFCGGGTESVMFSHFKSTDPAVFERQCKKWEETIRRGKLRFILTRGVLGWGCWMLVFMTCMSVFVDHHKLDMSTVVIELAIWPLAGYGVGLGMWRSLEKQFHDPANKPPSIIGN